jgi:hypothetical protein
VRKAILFALEDRRDSVILVHKGDMMKFTEGAFRDWGIELAKKEFPDELISRMDLATATFPQPLAAEFLDRGLLGAHIASIRAIYGAKLQAMVSALSRHMPDGVTWTEPEGGLFLWLQLPQGVNATEVSFFALKQRVAFVSGAAFFCNGSGQNTMRLNFSCPSQEQTEEGVRRLAEVIRHAIKSYRPITTVSREPLFALPPWVTELMGTPFNPAYPLPA